jgi:hypothetical protein
MGIELIFGNEKVISGKDRDGNSVFYNPRTTEQGTFYNINRNYAVYKGDLYLKSAVSYKLVAKDHYKVK